MDVDFENLYIYIHKIISDDYVLKFTDLVNEIL